MNYHTFLRSRRSAILTAVCVVALTLSSCMPIARYTPAQGGPNPPLDESSPLSQPQPSLVAVEPDLVPDVAPDVEGTEDAASTAEIETAPATPEVITVAQEAISMQAAISCLEAGDVVYGLALQNANVRQDADVDACRIGRIPKGSLVRISGSFDPANPGANVALASVFATAPSSDETSSLLVEETVTPDAAIITNNDASDATPAPTETRSAAFSALFPDLTDEPASADSPGEEAALEIATPILTLVSTPVAPIRATVAATSTVVSIAATAVPTAQLTSAEDAIPAIGYVEDIQPIFQRTCNSCHSGIVKSNDLQVTTYEGLMAGGKSGPPVIPGNTEASLLWTQIKTGYMPLIGELSESDKALIHDWIDAGAPETRPDASMQIAVDPVEVPTPRANTVPNAPAASAPAAATLTPEATLSFRPVAGSEANPEQTEALEEVRASSPVSPTPNSKAWGSWLLVNSDDYNEVADSCADPASDPLALVSSELIMPVACGVEPNVMALDLLRASLALPVSDAALLAASSAVVADTVAQPFGESTNGDEEVAADAEVSSPEAVVQPAAGAYTAASAGISAPALGVAAPVDADGWLIPRGGLCVERKLPDNDRSITALAFAPDGRLYIAFDSLLTGEVDPMILYDAFHPSRSVAVYDPNGDTRPGIIWDESTRITGLDYENGRLWVSRAGEVGVLSDGGEYEPLAGGFAVESHLFHANNGILVSGGWVYVSAGGVRDGYSEGPVVGISEGGAQAIVSGGNPYAARIVRAPIDALLSTRSITAFSTAARGVRNPYGITSDPSGRIWFTDNGATNVPEGISAGDEVSVLNPAAIGGGDEGASYYGFPLAIMEPQPWYVPPVVDLVNTAAPTGITWAMGTIYYAQYGRDPGLYRLGSSNGTVITERVLLGWPILAVTTAPDGALWIGMGDGGLFRITSGCAN